MRSFTMSFIISCRRFKVLDLQVIYDESVNINWACQQILGRVESYSLCVINSRDKRMIKELEEQKLDDRCFCDRQISSCFDPMPYTFFYFNKGSGLYYF